MPLLVTEVTLNDLVAHDWSSKLSASCQVTIQSAYYNEKLSVWEPIIEPVDIGGVYEAWSIDIKVGVVGRGGVGGKGGGGEGRGMVEWGVRGGW